MDHGPEDEREDGDRHDGARDREAGERLLGDPPAPEAPRPGRDVVAGVVGDGGQYALRDRSNRVTIACATTFVTSEITIRIAPR